MENRQPPVGFTGRASGSGFVVSRRGRSVIVRVRIRVVGPVRVRRGVRRRHRLSAPVAAEPAAPAETDDQKDEDDNDNPAASKSGIHRPVRPPGITIRHRLLHLTLPFHSWAASGGDGGKGCAVPAREWSEFLLDVTSRPPPGRLPSFWIFALRRRLGAQELRCPGRLDVAEGVVEHADYRAHLLVGNAVIDRLAVAPRRDEPFQAQPGQLLRHGRLAKIQEGLQFADRLLAVQQIAQDQKTRLMRQRLEKLGGFARACRHSVDIHRVTVFNRLREGHAVYLSHLHTCEYPTITMLSTQRYGGGQFRSKNIRDNPPCVSDISPLWSVSRGNPRAARLPARGSH